ncbi:hypothetical protein [Pendulispora albinea]|uniref:Peptidase M48 domain-containing protein n=1 Tax=Pendulispora albinea TaxID=2741071 RepID=A0ABZ2M5R7_9BACT
MGNGSPPGKPIAGGSRAETLIDEMKAEFPTFEILKKRHNRLQRAIHRALLVLTLGRMRTYLTQYHTVLFGKLWVPDSFDTMSDADRYILLRHERVHLRQRARMGDITMAFVYLIPFFPLGLAYGRARIEWEAYTETIRATYEVFGLPSAKLLRKHIVDRFVGPDYGWMWPFRRMVGRWFDEVIADLAAESSGSC